MSNKSHFLTTLFLLIFSLPALASQNCNYATNLVIQAYDAGESGNKYNEKQLLNQALRLCPNHAEAHNNLASLLEEQGDYTQAIAHYRQALQTKPNYSNAWYGLGETYYKQGQFPLSLEAHLQACKTDKDSERRIRELLENEKYAVTEQGKILNKESLLLLYDVSRRQKINQLISDCGFRLSRVKPAVTFRNFQFETGKATLKYGTEAQLEALAAALINLQTRRVEISGHTDNQRFAGFSYYESKQKNQQLSEQRAATVARALADRGVSQNRIITSGYGDSQPISRNRAKNRRVEIEVK
jgi:outer membrane protein OmpA-like peptidoglycan-associated protein